jgi:hypothetical protein
MLLPPLTPKRKPKVAQVLINAVPDKCRSAIPHVRGNAQNRNIIGQRPRGVPPYDFMDFFYPPSGRAHSPTQLPSSVCNLTLPRDCADVDVDRRGVFASDDRHHWLPEKIVIRKLEGFPSNLRIFVLEMMFPVRSKNMLGEKFIEQNFDARSRFVHATSFAATCFRTAFPELGHASIFSLK